MKPIIETIKQLFILGITEVYVVAFNLIALKLATLLLTKFYNKINSNTKLSLKKKYITLKSRVNSLTYVIIIFFIITVITLTIIAS